MNAKNEDNFLHGLATNVKTSLTKQHAAFTFESVHVRSLQIYKYFMVANYKYYIHNDTPCSESQNGFCSFRCVIWLLTQCFKLISFLLQIISTYGFRFSDDVTTVHSVCTLKRKRIIGCTSRTTHSSTLLVQSKLYYCIHKNEV